jgi:hypothetical protein
MLRNTSLPSQKGVFADATGSLTERSGLTELVGPDAPQVERLGLVAASIERDAPILRVDDDRARSVDPPVPDLG